MMRQYDFLPADLGETIEVDASKDDFDAATETMTTIMPLLYQSGYLDGNYAQRQQKRQQ